MSAHFFDPIVAKHVGLNAAVIYQNIVFWCEKNAANKQHIHEGRAWTYNSVAAFAEMFPYLTGNQIRRALELLEAEGYIGTGNFNETTYDRTKWYCDLRQIHSALMPNLSGTDAKPIPDRNTDITTDINNNAQDELALMCEEEASPKKRDRFDDFWKAYPKKTGKQDAKKAWDKVLKEGADQDKIVQACEAYAVWLVSGQPGEFRPHAKDPAGWLRSGRYDDEDLKPQAPAKRTVWRGEVVR